MLIPEKVQFLHSDSMGIPGVVSIRLLSFFFFSVLLFHHLSNLICGNFHKIFYKAVPPFPLWEKCSGCIWWSFFDRWETSKNNPELFLRQCLLQQECGPFHALSSQHFWRQVQLQYSFYMGGIYWMPCPLDVWPPVHVLLCLFMRWRKLKEVGSWTG